MKNTFETACETYKYYVVWNSFGDDFVIITEDELSDYHGSYDTDYLGEFESYADASDEFYRKF